MGLYNYLSEFITLIGAYNPYDVDEHNYKSLMLEFCNKYPIPFSQEITEGHITASAILLDPDKGEVLLLWHNKIQRWLQPGGHCEMDIDESVQCSALRELIEETGISPNNIKLVDAAPFDIDIHEVKARGRQPDHLHYDVRFLYVIVDRLRFQPQESFQWVSSRPLALMTDTSISRFARKLTDFQALANDVAG